MERLDPDRNEEGSAYSKRRTSILKMPRKSSWSSEVQQPEHVVECVKPSDKRMSKRVSFAAANDVLLFSKDVKNTSASPTPLQELTSDNATQQWIQMKTGEDEQFSGTNSFLKASKQREMPNVLSDRNYGKKAVCFDAQDLDATHCQTISGINQERCLLSSAEQGDNMDMTLSQTFNMFCDKDESFATCAVTTAFPFTNTHSAVYCDITDKENYFPKMKSVIQATDPLHCLFPQDIFTGLDKPNNKTTEMVFTREPSDNNQRITMKPRPLSGDCTSSGLPLQPEPLCGDRTVCFTAHDAGMDMTQCQTAFISRDLLPGTNMEPKQEAVATLPALGVKLAFENFFASLSGPKNEVKTTLGSNVKPSVDVDAEQPLGERKEDLPRERTIRFAAENLLHPVDCSVDQQKELPFSEKITRFDDALMDVTQCHTVKIAEDCATPLSDDSSILPKYGENTSQFTCDEVTADKPIHHSTTINAEPQRILDEDSPRAEKTMQFTSEEGAMDKTRCLTSNFGVEMKATDPLHCLFPQDIFTGLDNPNNKTTEKVFTREPSDNNQRLTMKPRPLSDDRTSSGLPLQPEPLCGDRTVCFTAHDAGMDMTQCQTAVISRDLLPGTNMEPKQEAVATLPALGVNLAFENFFASLSGQEKTTLESNIKPSVDVDAEQPPRERNENLPRERTIRFAAENLLHPVDISVDQQKELPFSEKTTRFDDALMDVTQCLTVKIAEDCATPLSDDSSILPKYGENTSQFTCDEVTADKPIHLSTTINAEPQRILDEDSPRAEKTVQFTSEEGVMDKTRCLTSNLGVEMKASLSNLSPVRPSITADVPAALKRREPFVSSNRRSKFLARHISNTVFNVRREQPRREKTENLPRERTMQFAEEVLLHPVDSSVDLQQELPFSEKTTRFNDALMDVTQCLTVKIAEDCAAPLSDNSSILPKCGENTSRFTCDEATADNPIHHSTTINAEEGVMDKTRCITSNIGVEMKASLSDLSPVCTYVTADVPAAQKKSEPMVFSNRRSRSLNRHDANAVLNVRSVPWGNPLPQETAETDDFSEVLHSKYGRGVLSIIEEKSIAEAKPKCENVDNGMAEASVQIHTESGVRNEQTVVEPLAQSEVEIHQCSPQTHDEDRVIVDETEQSPASMSKGDKSGFSPKSRGAVLADILSKMRRFSQQLMASDDGLADDNTLLSPPDPGLELGDGEAQQTFERDADLQKGECKSSTTPFKLETKRLMSRLSVVGFMPKLCKRSQSEKAKTPDEPETAQMHTARLDLNVSDINNEELGSYEDVSETLDSRSPDKEPEDMAVFGGFELDQELQKNIFEEEALVNEKKRPLEDDERTREDEKRIKTSNDTAILDSQACTLVGDNITSAVNTQTTISCICNHTVSLRCEGTLESSSMQSIYEYSLEDYADDIERKFEDGNITMLEFFKFFHMDFVIHNPRQSVAPGRVSSDVESSQMDVSRDRHIHAPRQQVYKANVRCLTEQVEGLKFRMRDLNKPLYLVNKALWEVMKNFTEAEFNSFSAKLKEIYSACRKTSRAKAHEMKEGLYTDLLMANAEVQEKLRASIQRANTMLNNLDDCMAELEAALAALEGDVKRGQEELSTVTEAISDRERLASELQVQNMYSADKLRRVKEEAKDVDRRLTMLHRMNEWRLKEMTRTTAIYTFLNETLHLKLTYKDTEGNDERKIVDVSLKHLLDERSQGHARLVHALLSQVTQAQSWTKRYSSSKDVFDLLRELSLVVSQCRLLGEEVRLLDTWGSMSLDILDIHCVRTDVYITFSSLQRLQKFEVVFSVGLTNQLYTLQLKSFRNVMGDTTIQNIQEVLSSCTPGHKYLTKTIKSIHKRFLS